VIQIQGLTKEYPTPAGTCRALRDIDLEIAAGEFLLVLGRSGSGKSTLLNMAAGIDRPTAGSVAVGSTAIAGLANGPLARWRGRNVGVVFQFFQLLPTLSVLENVVLPMDFCGTLRSQERRERALALLERVGVADQAGKIPAALSGGQQQRVAIARALANDPPVVLADEPTGNLDTATGADVLRLFGELAAQGKTVVVATHERDAIAMASRAITLVDGRLAS
jgi:putative ABC transport system ATP-binding protein